ncbi:hypothetical protein DL93DRAFT_548268 [Clavulina sp. PMI_390]|nr:hypothetical protein DL93DRAFT_548268 [Clavulina sp. PMI_390]
MIPTKHPAMPFLQALASLVVAIQNPHPHLNSNSPSAPSSSFDARRLAPLPSSSSLPSAGLALNPGPPVLRPMILCATSRLYHPFRWHIPPSHLGCAPKRHTLLPTALVYYRVLLHASIRGTHGLHGQSRRRAILNGQPPLRTQFGICLVQGYPPTFLTPIVVDAPRPWCQLELGSLQDAIASVLTRLVAQLEAAATAPTCSIEHL